MKWLEKHKFLNFKRMFTPMEQCYFVFKKKSFTANFQKKNDK